METVTETETTPTPTPTPTVNQAVGGIWYGTNADGIGIDLFIAENGDLHFLTEEDDNAVGTITAIGNSITVNLSLHASPGEVFDDEHQPSINSILGAFFHDFC